MSEASSIASPEYSDQGSSPPSPLSPRSPSPSDDGSDDGVDDGSMTLPPEGHFPSFEALERHAQIHAQHHGYGISNVRWKWRYKNRTTCRKYTIGCHCTSKYRDRLKGRQRRRQKSTVKTDCKFSFHALQNEDGSYDLQHRFGVEFRTHNHGPTLNPAVHHQHRKLRGPALQQATALIASGLEVKDIVAIMSTSEHVDIPPIAMDITNLMQKIQALELNGNTSIDALLATMDEQGWIYEHEVCPETGRLTRLFMASKACLEYAKKHPDILIMDSTYKTNRFEMPLLDIIGMPSNLIQILF
jgi:hypothetical protein